MADKHRANSMESEVCHPMTLLNWKAGFHQPGTTSFRPMT